MTAARAPSDVLTIEIRLDREGPVVAREAVTDADLVDARSEAWWRTCARRGHPHDCLESFAPRLEASFRDAGSEAVVPDLIRVSEQAGAENAESLLADRQPPAPARRERPERPGRRCVGFMLRATAPDGVLVTSHFDLASLETVARRAASKLRERGDLEAGDHCYYYLRAETASRRDAAKDVDAAVRIAEVSTPLRYDSVPVRPLLERATVRGHLPQADVHPVFYTRAALELAERCARRGARQHPPVETGGLLIGPLCSCPETGEMFVVVTDVIEAADAEGTKFTLTYSSSTWSRIQNVLEARRARPELRNHRILGQVHGHNFLPANGAPPCAACSELEVCGRTTAYLSLDDESWSRAVFAGEPWQLGHIFGFNAREEGVDALFGLHGGRLTPRNYRVLDDFEPSGRQG